MQESYLATCLEAAFKTVKTRRLNVVGRCPEFTLLEKPWKELVKLAVLETEIPGQDEDGETIAPSPRFRRGRRRGKQQSVVPTRICVHAGSLYPLFSMHKSKLAEYYSMTFELVYHNLNRNL